MKKRRGIKILIIVVAVIAVVVLGIYLFLSRKTEHQDPTGAAYESEESLEIPVPITIEGPSDVSNGMFTAKLTLEEDNTFTVFINFSVTEDIEFGSGEWVQEEDGTVTVFSGGEESEDIILTPRAAGDGGDDDFSKIKYTGTYTFDIPSLGVTNFALESEALPGK